MRNVKDIVYYILNSNICFDIKKNNVRNNNHLLYPGMINENQLCIPFPVTKAKINQHKFHNIFKCLIKLLLHYLIFIAKEFESPTTLNAVGEW